MSDIRGRCAEVMAEVMEVEPGAINNDSSPDTLEQWDSLSHVQLVLKLEKAFGVKISPEEGIEHFTSFGSIVDYITKKVG